LENARALASLRVFWVSQACWSWAPLAEIDYSHTEVRSANTGWGGSGALWVGTASQWLEPVASAGALTRYVKHVDTSGNQSNTAAVATATVTTADIKVGTVDIDTEAVTKVYDLTPLAGPITRSNIF
jgi:hypothetical protein